MTRANRPIRPAHRRERGMALAITLFAMATLLMTAASAMLMGSADARATRNYRGASQAHFTAESAITHALQVVNGIGVVHFENEIVDGWSSAFGANSRSFGSLSGWRYSVVAVADAGDPSQRGLFRATATGPEGNTNVVVARLLRADIPSTAPGAIYLAADAPTNANFNGNAWEVDGNDHNYTGGAGPANAIPGISTRNATNTQEVVGSLGGQQLDNVEGLGFQAGPPVVPSVMTYPYAPTTAQMNQMVDDILAQGGIVTNNDTQINGNVTFGTTAAPQITYFPQSTQIRGNGNASGAGILIVDGDLIIQGTLDFKGLIIVRGQTAVTADSETEVTGSATLYGSLWTNDINLVVGGSAIVRYSTEALALANDVVVTGALPAPMTVVSLADCALVSPGTGGCP